MSSNAGGSLRQKIGAREGAWGKHGKPPSTFTDSLIPSIKAGAMKSAIKVQ